MEKENNFSLEALKAALGSYTPHVLVKMMRKRLCFLFLDNVFVEMMGKILLFWFLFNSNVGMIRKRLSVFSLSPKLGIIPLLIRTASMSTVYFSPQN